MNTHNDFTYKPFVQGVWSILHVEWQMKTKTPLVIRNGEKAAYSQDPEQRRKSRGRQPKLLWKNAGAVLHKNDNAYSEIADLNYIFKADGDQLECEYHIPASSIRGALRNSAISRKVEFENRTLFSLPKKKADENGEQPDEAAQAQTLADIEKRIEAAKNQLIEKRNGWFDILSLFGIAFNPLEDPDNPLTWAGRLRLETKLSPITGGKVTVNDQPVEVSDGPQNIPRTVGLRSPLDRTTQSAKATGGGIHHWLELPPNNTFTVTFRILNPAKSDLELLEFWRKEIEKDRLAFGALQSIGRGKVSLADPKYKLFASPTAPFADLLEKRPQAKLETNEIDPLADFWTGSEMSLDELNELNFEKGK